MKKLFVYFFHSWWLPTLLYCGCLVLFMMYALYFLKYGVLIFYGLFLGVILAFATLLASAIWNLIRKRWWTGFLSGLSIAGCSLLTFHAFSFLSFFLMFGPIEDGFADRLTIPHDIELAEPNGDLYDIPKFEAFMADPPEDVDIARAHSSEFAQLLTVKGDHPLHLLPGIQPGKYRVIYTLNPGEPGWVYLKAFEVTHGTPLSAGRLQTASKTRMAWSRDPSERFATWTRFTIYEGDRGKPYAARLEVWFQPDSGEPERQLARRDFKIEGWQR